jgi:hypothetical protein
VPDPQLEPDLTLAGAVHAERGDPAAEELLFPPGKLLLDRLRARDEQGQRRALDAPRAAEVPTTWCPSNGTSIRSKVGSRSRSPVVTASTLRWVSSR